MLPKISIRMTLEKDLRTLREQQKRKEDFTEFLDLYKKDGSILGDLTSFVNEVMEVKGLKDMTEVFEADARKQVGKITMKW